VSEQSSTRVPVPSLDDRFNLGRRRAARHEKRGLPPFVLDEERGISIQAPPGLPIPAFEPLLRVDLDWPLLWRIVDAAQAEGGAEAAGRSVIDFFVGNPNLPRQVVDALIQVLRNLFKDEGFAALVAWAPEPEDMREIASILFEHYGATLGEAFGSSGSSKASGEPSKPTSDGSTGSISATSTQTPELPPGSAAAA
jgi:hypothetical protein